MCSRKMQCHNMHDIYAGIYAGVCRNYDDKYLQLEGE